MKVFVALFMLLESLMLGAAKPQQVLRGENPRIINGSDATPNRYPYTVSIQNQDGHWCGGSVIAPDMVLSAAHCAPRPSYYFDSNITIVITNPHNVHQQQESAEVFKIENMTLHPHYELLNYGVTHDLMIIKLDGSTNHSIIRLNTDEMLPEIGSSLRVMGWGITNNPWESNYYANEPSILQEVDVIAMSNEKCERVYPGEIFPESLCALEAEQGPCYGDSGGPLIILGENYTEDIQVGVVSWGKECASGTYPGVFARVEEEFNWIKLHVCNLSDSPPSYFDCVEGQEHTWSPAPSYFPTSPTSSPVPTKEQTNILIEIQLDNYPYQTGWLIKDNDGDIIYEVSPSTYMTQYALVSEVVALEYDSEYTFTITDTARDGLYGRATLYLGDIADDNKVLGNYDSNYNDFYEQYFRSYDIKFRSGEEGILANLIPSTTPTISQLPTSIPSNIPSIEPTSPTASPAPTKEQTNILIEIQLDNYPYETGWFIKGDDGDIVYEVSPFTYMTQYALVSEVVALDYDSEYTFTITDTARDGLSGRVTLYLGDIADDNKVLGNYDSNYLNDFYEQYFRSYDIKFRSGEEGILANIIPSTTPTISPLPTSSSIPSTPPTASPAPTKEQTNILIEIQLDNYPYQTGWFIKGDDGDIVYEVSPFTYMTQYALVSEVVALEYDSEYTFTITDNFGDGLSGRVTLYLGDIADENKILGNYDYSYGVYFGSSYDINFLAGDEGTTTPTVNPIEPMSSPPSFVPTVAFSSLPSFIPTAAPTHLPTPNPTTQIQTAVPTPDLTEDKPSNAQSGKKGGNSKTKEEPKSQKQKKH